MAASDQDTNACVMISDKKRYTVFNTDQFIIHALHKGNPVYSEMMNQTHTNLVFYDKALPYPTQPDQDYISRTGTRKAGEMQTGVILDNPTSYLAYLDSRHFTQCGGYYFLAFYDQALYHKARLVARFKEKDTPVHEGWSPEFNTVIMDKFLVRVFVSKKQNEETGCKDAKMCVYYLGDLTKKHGLGPKNWLESEPNTICQLRITLPIAYPGVANYMSIPTWSWIACNNSLYCKQTGQITAYNIVLATDESLQIVVQTVHDKNIHQHNKMSTSSDGSKLFIISNHTQHTHDIYGEDSGYDDGCTHWNETQLAFNLPELTISNTHPGTAWLLRDIASLDESDKGEFILKFHNPRNMHQVSIVTPFTVDTGLNVQYTHMNATPGRHYVIIGTCMYSSRITSYVYILDEEDNAIYTYQLPPNIPIHVLTEFDISVFGDGQLMIGGFREPHSVYSGQTANYAVNPMATVDAIKQVPIHEDLIRLVIGYL